MFTGWSNKTSCCGNNTASKHAPGTEEAVTECHVSSDVGDDLGTRRGLLIKLLLLLLLVLLLLLFLLYCPPPSV